MGGINIKMFEFVFYIYLFLTIAVISIPFILIFYFVHKDQKKIKQALDLVLYEITLPAEKPKDKGEEDIKKVVAPMEQFYQGMIAKGFYFVLEIGLPVKGKEVVFYCAVDKKQTNIFEKNIQGIFPYAHIRVKKEDYNIFRPHGYSLGSVAKLKKEDVLPIKTYDKFQTDPLQVLINIFSKLQEEGEGAAMQMIVSPLAGDINKKAISAAKAVKEGKSLKDAAKKDNNLLDSFIKELGSFFGLGGSKDEKKEDKPKPIDENLAQLLELKASRQVVGINLRLISSAESEEKAESILKELESAFLQYEDAQTNGLKFLRLKDKNLKKLFYNFSFRIPDDKYKFPLNTAELSTIFHLPLGIFPAAAPQLKYLKTKEAPPPLNLPKSGLLLGKNTYRGEVNSVYMKDDDRRRHFYVIGQTGTGKTTFLKNMIVQDIEAGKGVCFIDPHGSDVFEILARVPLSRAEDVIYFNPGDTSRPMGLNMLEYDPSYPEQKTFIVNELLGIFNKLFDMKTVGGPAFEQYFRNATLLVMEDPSSGNTLIDVARIFTDKDFRDYKISKCQNPIVVTFWRELAEKATGEQALQNYGPYITNKFDNFISNDIMRPIIGQEKSAFNFRKVMDEQKILLINLSKGRLGDLNANLLGLILVGKLLMAALSRVDMPEEQRKDFYLYIDEFQNVTTDSIAVILSEARKYKLDLIIAHQFIGQLDEQIKKAVFGNVGSMASFRVGVEDSEFLEKQFEPVFNAYDLINIDNYNAYTRLLIDGQPARPFSLKILPFTKANPQIGEDIAKISSLKYGRPKVEVEEEIKAKYRR